MSFSQKRVGFVLHEKMDASIDIVKEKRLKLKWTTKELAEKANVPYSAVLRIEKGIGKWPDYISSINKVLDDALKKKQINKNSLPLNLNPAVDENPPSFSKYIINTKKIDIEVYFPNLSEGEERRLFGYSRRDKVQSNSVDTPKIKFRPIKRGERLGAALEHAKTLADSYSNKKRKIPKEYFTPNFNLIACKWLELFDNVNHTKGLYATQGGEYYIEELGFFPDYFNPELKLIMEWDEAHHFINGELSFQDIERQNAIQKLFPDYEFVRIREDDFKDYLDL